MKFKGHTEIYYADWIMIGIGGAMLYYRMDWMLAIVLLAGGAFLHFSMK